MKEFIKRHFAGQGGISEVVRVSVPIMISQGSNSLMLFTDRYILSSLGAAEPAASMAGGFMALLLSIFFFGVLSYVTPIVAQYLGAGQRENCAVALIQGLVLTAIVYPVLLVVGHVLAPIYLAWTGAQPQETLFALQYFDVVNAGSIEMLANVAFSSFFAGLGMTRVVMVINGIGMIVNIPLTYFWVHQDLVPWLNGVRGAAFGTVISGCLMLALFVLILLRRKFRREYGVIKAFRFDESVVKKLLRFGAPTGAEFFLSFFAFSSFVAFFHSYGIHEALAMTITFNWDIVGVLPLWGLNIGVMSLVGMYMGAKQVHLAQRATSSGAVVAFSLSALYSVVFAVGSSWMVTCMLPPNLGADRDHVFELSRTMLQMVSLYCWGNAINLIYSAALRAAGDTRICLVIAIVGEWSMLAATYASIRVWHLSPLGTWYVFISFIGFIGLLYFIRYKQGKWKNMRVVDEGPEPGVVLSQE